MMPRRGQSVEDYVNECLELSGKNLPRASVRDVEKLKELGYRVHEVHEEPYVNALRLPRGYEEPRQYVWYNVVTTDFQDDVTSLSEADSWACAKQHAIATTGETFEE